MGNEEDQEKRGESRSKRKL